MHYTNQSELSPRFPHNNACIYPVGGEATHQVVVVKLYSPFVKIFVVQIRIWKMVGRWRGHLMILADHDTKTKSYRFISEATAATWFREDWYTDFVKDLGFLTNHTFG